jgi:hypothetical protein
MFLGRVYNSWQTNPPGRLTYMGNQRSNFMNELMGKPVGLDVFQYWP